jgi:hypothetical protein
VQYAQGLQSLPLTSVCFEREETGRFMYRFALDQNEQILKKGMASLHIDREAFSGALYLTTERLVFVGYVHGVNTKYDKAVLLKHIKEIKPEKTLFIIPNALAITLHDQEQFELIVHGRHEWLETIRYRMSTLLS